MSVERPMGILQRSAELVRLLADEGNLTPAEIADRVDTPRPTVYRLGDALDQADLTETLSGSRIKLSLRWLRLADAARAAMSEWQHARPILQDLAEQTGQTVFLSVSRDRQSVCIDWVQGQAINVLLLKPGRALPLYAGAEGRTVLAFGTDDVDGYLQQAPFPTYNTQTLTTAAQLRRDITRSRAQGYVISDEDVSEGIGALGAPLRNTRTDAFAGTLSVAGLAEDLTACRTEFAETLLEAAGRLSATLP